MTVNVPPVLKNNYFESLQALRALAAILVAIEHILYEIFVSFRGNPDAMPLWVTPGFPFVSGVDIFFVLSGFLMVYTTRDIVGGVQKASWATFFKKRIIRIVPLYWFYTSVMVAILLVAPQLFGKAQADLWHFIQSYLFIPHERPSGGVKPILSLGWTLNYEMFFYAVFAACMFLSQKWMIRVMAFVFLLLSILHFYIPQNLTMIFFWSNPIILEFIAGMIIARLYLIGFRLPLWVIWAACAIAIYAFIYIDFITTIAGVDIRRLPCAIIAINLIGGFTLCRGMDVLKINKPLKILGDASYTFYLAHPFFIGAIGVISGFLLLPPAVHFALSLFICIIGSVAAYFIIEKPMMGFLKGKSKKGA